MFSKNERRTDLSDCWSLEDLATFGSEREEDEDVLQEQDTESAIAFDAPANAIASALPTGRLRLPTKTPSGFTSRK